MSLGSQYCSRGRRKLNPNPPDDILTAFIIINSQYYSYPVWAHHVRSSGIKLPPSFKNHKVILLVLG